jgi:hypothetical protein
MLHPKYPHQRSRKPEGSIEIGGRLSASNSAYHSPFVLPVIPIDSGLISASPSGLQALR